MGFNWDSKFNKHFKVIKDGLTNNPENNDPSIFQETFKFFFEYGIIGVSRSKKLSKKYNEESIANLKEVNEIFKEMKDFIKKEGYFNDIESENIDRHFGVAYKYWDNMMQHQDKLKYPAITPTGASMLVPESCSCDVFITDKPSFILPDCTAVMERANVFFKHMGVPLEHVRSIGIPLDPYTFVRIKNNEVLLNEKNEWMHINDDQVKKINYTMFCRVNSEFVFAEGTNLDFIPE